MRPAREGRSRAWRSGSPRPTPASPPGTCCTWWTLRWSRVCRRTASSRRRRPARTTRAPEQATGARGRGRAGADEVCGRSSNEGSDGSDPRPRATSGRVSMEGDEVGTPDLAAPGSRDAPPRCSAQRRTSGGLEAAAATVDCGCGGPLRCGTQCSALVSNNIGGYDVCTTIGRVSKSHISLIDESNPQKGVVVKMFSSKCSISVFLLCDTTVAQVSDKFILSGSCDYATTLRHPSGCARSVSASGNDWGWLGILFVIILCLLGGYILIGAIYRYYFLGIHSVEAIPNLEFWISLLQRIKSMFVPSARSPRGHSRHSRGPYSPLDH